MKYIFDQDYVNGLAQGNAQLEEHFASYFGSLLRIKLRVRLRTIQIQDEVVQETLRRALEKLRQGGLERPERLGAFVNSICENVISEVFRSAAPGSAALESIPEPEGSDSTENDFFITKERRALVEGVLKSLSENDRTLLRAVFLEERDKAEICRNMGVSPDYLRVRLQRAANRLRTAINDRSSQVKKSLAG